jgi:hypothetical protein
MSYLGLDEKKTAKHSKGIKYPSCRLSSLLPKTKKFPLECYRKKLLRSSRKI